MNYSRACDLLGLTTPKSPRENAEMAERQLRHMTAQCPLKYKVAAQVLIDAYENEKWRCRLVGEEESFKLVDNDGNAPQTLRESCRTAELVYGSAWADVFDGHDGTDRDSAIHDGLLD